MDLGFIPVAIAQMYVKGFILRMYSYTDTAFAGMEIVGVVLSKVCYLLELSFRQSSPFSAESEDEAEVEGEGGLDAASARVLLQVMAKVDSTVVEVGLP